MYLYKIKCLTTNDFYIGSTCNFKRRTYEHRTRFKCNTRNNNDKLYDFMRINGGLDNFTFEILFTFDNITKKELLIKEDKLITDLIPTLNAIKSYNTKKDNFYCYQKFENFKLTLALKLNDFKINKLIDKSQALLNLENMKLSVEKIDFV